MATERAGAEAPFPTPKEPTPLPKVRRPLLSRLILLFVTVPLLELVLLLQVGEWIGLGPTVALVVATGFAGAALARQQGLRAFHAVQRELSAGGMPGQSVLDGLSILVGGALLLTPGILTDVVGFGLILPLSRRSLQRVLRRRLERRIKEGALHFTVFGSSGFGGSEPFARTRPPSSHGDAPSGDQPPDDRPRQELGVHPPGRNPLRRPGPPS